MRARPSKASKVVAAAAGVLLLAAGCTPTVHGTTTSKTPKSQTSWVVPLATAIAPPPRAPLGQLESLEGLDLRIQQADEQAADRGATISVAVLDRATGQLFANGNAQTMAIASVAKLFIADDLLLRTELSADDRTELDAMLRSSDDTAGELFWSQGGGDAIITRVTARYGLGSTRPGSNGHWWNTISTPTDLVRYYDMLLNGSGGLPPEQANIILDDLTQSTATGIDGYPQRFGIPDALFSEPVAVKQGWMCCIGANWMHLSTGVIGVDHRYVMAIGSQQPGDDANARVTITEAVKTIFPGGHI